MAEDTSQERTERATPKRLQQAREKGQIPRSRELTTTLLLLASSAGLLMMGESVGRSILEMLQNGLALDAPQWRDPDGLVGALGARVLEALLGIAPLLVVLAVVALAAPLLLGGWMFSAKALAFKWGKLDPIKGLGRVFSLRGLMELGKALAKFAVVAVVAAFYIWHLRGDLAVLAREGAEAQVLHVFELLGTAFLVLSSAMILVALVDVPFQLWDHGRQLRMTRQEVKDELKETEGRPEVKGRIRSLQREMARSRMMAEVPKADVVITNPTHYAVALAYDPQRAEAPVLVAKGVELVAARIRGVAIEHKVPVMEFPPLARALYHSTELNQSIPAQLYVVVAHVFAYVYQLRAARRNGTAEPAPPDIMSVHTWHGVPILF